MSQKARHREHVPAAKASTGCLQVLNIRERHYKPAQDGITNKYYSSRWWEQVNSAYPDTWAYLTGPPRHRNTLQSYTIILFHFFHIHKTDKNWKGNNAKTPFTICPKIHIPKYYIKCNSGVLYKIKTISLERWGISYMVIIFSSFMNAEKGRPLRGRFITSQSRF